MRRALLLAVMCALGACAQHQAAADRIVPGVPWPVDAAAARGLSDAQVQALYVRWRNGEPMPAPTYAAPRQATRSAPIDYGDGGGYAGPSVLTERDAPAIDDDGPPSSRSVLVSPMGNGATIFSGDIGGIALPLGNGSTLYSFD